MPQFDSFSFSNQVFWTLVGFSFFYFFILRVYLTNFSEIFKFRQKLLNTYLKKNTNFFSNFHKLDFFIIIKA